MVSVGPIDQPKIVDIIFGVLVPSPLGSAAALAFGRSVNFGEPLVLMDWRIEQLSPAFWQAAVMDLQELTEITKPRYGIGSVFTESESMASQARGRGLNFQAIPEHLASSGYWDTLILSSMSYVRGGAVVITKPAWAKIVENRSDSERRPRFGGLDLRPGPRGDDPSVAAMAYGIILALDETAARDAA